MPSSPKALEGSFLPCKPKAEPTHSGWEDLIERIAAELYRITSMAIGEGEEAVGLIEQVITQADLPASRNHDEARHSCRLLLAGKAIGLLRERDAATLAAPDTTDAGPVSCIEGDELDAAGVTSAELEEMIAGPDSQRLRSWLEGLSVPLRIVFVLRAVAGLTSAEVAGELASQGGPAAEDWTPDSVRSTFRQALCSLASQLLHDTATR